jgi:rRNA-processing protein FCF1
MKEFYLMTEEREKTLWDEALVVLDTNSICAMYRMTKDTQKTMLEILKYLKDKLWIPGHVLYEYQKNRMEIIKEPISKWYGNRLRGKRE